MTTLDAVCAAALRIADAEGLEALSMRRLADELQIGAMSLYRYVRTKDELLDAIATRVLSDLPVVDPQHDTWEERLELAAHHLHVALREHPGVGQIVASRGAPIAALDRFRENLLEILADAGFAPERAVEIVSAMAIYTSGFAEVERQRAGVRPEAEAARLRSLDREEFPHLSASADHYAGHISQHAFTEGLRAFIRGLR